MALRRGSASTTKAAGAVAVRRYVVFSLAGVEYALEARHVKHSLPASTKPDREILFLGKVYPLLDFRSLFRLPAFSSRGRFILLIEGETLNAGLLVDAITGLVTIGEAAIVPLPKVFRGVEREWFSGLGRLGGGTVVVMRTEGIFSSSGAWAPSKILSPAEAVT